MRNRILYLSLFTLSSIILFQACLNEQQIKYKLFFVNGKGLYEKHCQNCHNYDGTGLKSLYPPLTDTLFIKSNKGKLACIIKYGSNSKIKVSGRQYEYAMPANTQLSDIDIAEIVVYIGNSFGNKIGYYDTSEANAGLKNCNSIK